jgi:hypothetical protein
LTSWRRRASARPQRASCFRNPSAGLTDWGGQANRAQLLLG